MQLALLGVLLLVALALIFLGYYSKERAYSLVGFAFLFILGFWSIMEAGLEVQTGVNHIYTYGNSSLITGETETYTYTTINDSIIRFFGVWLAVLGVVGAAITTSEIRRGVI